MTMENSTPWINSMDPPHLKTEFFESDISAMRADYNETTTPFYEFPGILDSNTKFQQTPHNKGKQQITFVPKVKTEPIDDIENTYPTVQDNYTQYCHRRMSGLIKYEQLSPRRFSSGSNTNSWASAYQPTETNFHPVTTSSVLIKQEQMSFEQTSGPMSDMDVMGMDYIKCEEINSFKPCLQTKPQNNSKYDSAEFDVQHSNHVVVNQVVKPMKYELVQECGIMDGFQKGLRCDQQTSVLDNKNHLLLTDHNHLDKCVTSLRSPLSLHGIAAVPCGQYPNPKRSTSTSVQRVFETTSQCQDPQILENENTKNMAETPIGCDTVNSGRNLNGQYSLGKTSNAEGERESNTRFESKSAAKFIGQMSTPSVSGDGSVSSNNELTQPQTLGLSMIFVNFTGDRGLRGANRDSNSFHFLTDTVSGLPNTKTANCKPNIPLYNQQDKQQISGINSSTQQRSQYQLNLAKTKWQNQRTRLNLKGPKYFSDLTEEELRMLKKPSGEQNSETPLRVRCDTCSWAFRDYQPLVDHMLKQHETTPEYPFRCVKCCKNVESSFHFFRDHTGNRCEICGSTSFTKSKNAKEYHKIRYHYNMFGCVDCGQRYQDVRVLRKHLLEFPEHKPENPCHLCGKICKSPSDLKKHISYHKNGFPYKCDKCPYETQDRKSLSHHAAVHVTTKDHKCPICGKSFASSCRVETHIRTLHSGLHVCPFCGVSLRGKESYDSHLARHKDEKDYECQICNKKFPDVRLLRNHKRRKHPSTNKPYQCDICGRLFVNPALLKQHMVSHTIDTPHKCDVCQKRFKRIQNLRSHMRTHGDDRQYKCEICGDGFKWPHNLRNHLKTHNAEKDVNE